MFNIDIAQTTEILPYGISSTLVKSFEDSYSRLIFRGGRALSSPLIFFYLRWTMFWFFSLAKLTPKGLRREVTLLKTFVALCYWDNSSPFNKSIIENWYSNTEFHFRTVGRLGGKEAESVDELLTIFFALLKMFFWQ